MNNAKNTATKSTTTGNSFRFNIILRSNVKSFIHFAISPYMSFDCLKCAPHSVFSFWFSYYWWCFSAYVLCLLVCFLCVFIPSQSHAFVPSLLMFASKRFHSSVCLRALFIPSSFSVFIRFAINLHFIQSLAEASARNCYYPHPFLSVCVCVAVSAWINWIKIQIYISVLAFIPFDALNYRILLFVFVSM